MSSFIDEVGTIEDQMPCAIGNVGKVKETKSKLKKHDEQKRKWKGFCYDEE